MKARVILQSSEGVVDTQMIDINTIQEFPAIIVLRDYGKHGRSIKQTPKTKGRTYVIV